MARDDIAGPIGRQLAGRMASGVVEAFRELWDETPME
jgi:hypothetical protein